MLVNCIQLIFNYYNNINYITTMFRKTDFNKIELLGSGKKHTKIYKVVHNTTGKIYALK
jgi:hypothetical protein